MNDVNAKYCLVILSNHKYEDLWHINLHYLRKNWPEIYDRTFIVTDKKIDALIENISVISIESPFFSERLHEALKKISAKFIVLLLDDYFLTKRIQNSKIETIIKIMEVNNIDYVRLFKIPNQRKKQFDSNKKLYKLNININYSINLQPSVWNKESLLKISQEFMNPWEFEVAIREKSLENNYNCHATNGEELPFNHGLLRGRFFRKTYRKIKQDCLIISGRKKMNIIEELRYKFISFVAKITPGRMKTLFKKILKKVGYKFYTK